ncbi:MAG: hypothetical protein ACI4M5_00770 [Christensenellales bacterium]
MKTVYTNPETLAIFEEVKEQAKELFPEYFANYTITLVVRETRRQLGCCAFLNHASNNNSGDTPRRAEISISKYLTEEEYIRRVLVHEFGHFVTPGQRHTATWKARADKIGEKWGIVCHTKATFEETIAFEMSKKQYNLANEPRPKYMLVCQQCGNAIFRTRLSKSVRRPDKYKCGRCGGKIVRFDLDNN